jgi:hypothetical protein
MSALGSFEASSFDPAAMRAFAAQFDREVFKTRMRDYIMQAWSQFDADFPQPHM